MPSNFTETNCITCQEAQAMGAIPIFKPVWAIGEYCQHGILIHGDPYGDALVQARYVGEIFRLASNVGLQEKIRPEMMSYARERFNWERSVDILEKWMLGLDDQPNLISQYVFQHKHATGGILNVGSAFDPSDLRKRGAVNLDICETDMGTKQPNNVDILADCRDLPDVLNGRRFDTVILGEILEHFPVEEVPEIICRASMCLSPGGRVIITVPDDHRPAGSQHVWAKGDEEYVPGVAACHTHRISKETVIGWLEAALLRATVFQEIDYTHCLGHGIVAVKEEGDVDR
jgi:hypothetical protein